METVPQDTFWIAQDNVFLGRISLRQRFNKVLEIHGGHVGYEIREACRDQGIGTQALKLVRDYAATKGMDKLLLTCNVDNLASERVILKNGGIYERTQEAIYGYNAVKRFWVPTI